MIAGRELDALVAEKVMGLRRVTEYSEEFAYPHYPGDFVNSDGHRVFSSFDEPTHQLPKYSSDISAAWEVVEKFIKFNPFWEENDSLWFDLSPTKPPGWYCNFGDSSTSVYADTAPLAICLAALKAVGVEI
jgi:hypothetical protein